jgi:hypothetical protein
MVLKTLEINKSNLYPNLTYSSFFEFSLVSILLRSVPESFIKVCFSIERLFRVFFKKMSISVFLSLILLSQTLAYTPSESFVSSPDVKAQYICLFTWAILLVLFLMFRWAVGGYIDVKTYFNLREMTIVFNDINVMY